LRRPAPPTLGGRTFEAEFTLPEWDNARHSAAQSQSQNPAATAKAKAETEPHLEDPAFDLKTHSLGPAIGLVESLAGPDSSFPPLQAPPAHEKGEDKGNSDQNHAKNEQEQAVSAKPAKPAPKVVQTEAVDEGRKSRKKELTQEQKNSM